MFKHSQLLPMYSLISSGKNSALFSEACTDHSPTLYSQITGKYVSVESKIFPRILLLCSISYSCFNGLTINQHFIKPLQGEKCTSYLSVVDLSIVLPRVFFFAALCGRTNLRLRSRARMPTKLLRSTFYWLFTIKRGRIG